MRRNRKLCLTAALGAVAALAALPAGAGAATFTNQASIGIGATAVADTYPSTINVSGLTGTVTKVRASLFGVTGTGTDRMQVLLVGPAGQTTVLMRDTCGDEINGPTFTFDDAAPGLLPNGNCSGQSGTFKPTDRDPADNAFTAPAPALPYGTTLSVFNGSPPNGAWKLFIEDDINGGIDSHTIGGGWNVDIETTPPVLKKKCKKGRKLVKVKGKKKCVKKKKK